MEFQDMLSQPSTATVAPEMLEMLGRKAASMFLQNGVSLNDSVRQLISDQPNLNNEHVRRVIEFANNTAFQELFQSSQDKNVHFEVADPGVVIRDMKDGGSPVHDGKTLAEGKKDFMAPPRAQGDMGDAELSQLFTPQQDGATSAPMAKLASEDMEVPHASHANPVEDVYDTYLGLQACKDDLALRNDVAESMLKTAKDDLYKAVKEEVLRYDGSGLGGVVAALEKIAARDKIAAIVPDLIHKLLDDGIHPHHLEQSLVKIAGVVVNPNHPLILAWGAMEKAAEARVVLSSALQEVDSELTSSHNFLRQAAR